jgi:rhamnopyranosyl-N-acetylglucosaminyl-diphospho-decaprenol beta-1,3/1,4-galactofuranosyltransferase
MASFVGLLVRADAARRIGLPKAEFFLNHDDAEYSLRLRREGAMWLIPASRILHKDALGVGKTVRRKRFGRVSERVPEARLWFYYFSVRNLVYLARHSLPPLSFLRQLSVYALRQVLGVLVYDNRRGTRLTCLGRALADGFRGRFDNAFPFRLTSRLAERGTRRQQVSE